MNLTIYDKKRGNEEKRETSSFDISTFVPRISNYNKLDSLDIVSTQKTASSLKDTGIEFFSFYAPSLPRFVQRIKRISLRYSAILRGCGKDRMGREAFSSRIGNPPLPSI